MPARIRIPIALRRIPIAVILSVVGVTALTVFALVVDSGLRSYRDALLGETALAAARAVGPESGPQLEGGFFTIPLQRDDVGGLRPSDPGAALPPELATPLAMWDGNDRMGLANSDEGSIAWAIARDGDSAVLAYRPYDAAVVGTGQVLWLPFGIAGVLLLWVLAWCGLSVGGLVERARRQNDLLVEHARELEDARDRARHADRTKSTFLANMSHELRGPMTGVLGITELLRGLDLSDDARGYADRIHASSTSLIAILNDILDFSKLDAAQLSIDPVPVQIEHLVGDTLAAMEICATEKGLAFGVTVTEDVPEWLELDPVRVGQILMNLVGNSVKFTDHGAIRVFVDAEPNGDSVELLIRVMDTGIGIEAEAVDAIFGEFVQADASIVREFGGTGLGLTITRQLVDLMNGSIEVKSMPGRGSTFRIGLPVSIAEAPTDQASDADAGRPGGVQEAADATPLRVLVVEDDPQIRRMLGDMLRTMGIEAEVATNGREAIERYATNPVDLILLDYRMPDLNGPDAAARLREIERVGGLRRARIVAVTGNATEEDRRVCMDAGMDDVLFKPVRLGQIRDAVAAARTPDLARIGDSA